MKWETGPKIVGSTLLGNPQLYNLINNLIGTQIPLVPKHGEAYAKHV